jgi:parallel beta-helix repeat protein
VKKKTFRAATTVFFILVSLAAGGIQVVEAQTYQAITIKPDGSVEPETGLFQRSASGTTYTFEGDIFGSIMVQKSYITIDGAGYTLEDQSGSGITLAGPDLSHRECKGVLVLNLTLRNCGEGIYSVGASNNSFIGNYFDKSGIHLMASEKYVGDLVKYNTFNDTVIFVDYNHGGLDVITENNFFGSSIWVGLSDAPFVDKNYWSDYKTKYPNAKEVGHSGIWDTPYVSNIIDGTMIDYHPLVNPIANFKIPDSSKPNTTPSPSPSPNPQPTAEPNQTQTATPSPSPIPSPTLQPTGEPTNSPSLTAAPSDFKVDSLWVAAVVVLVVVVLAVVLFSWKRLRKN